ncbi:protein C3orf33-like [Lineus longissimus]|uniref:protein C3orf33-like n=1 Tax=Lineus longissimus TaxID=88925 RepID=UPI002B4DEF33
MPKATQDRDDSISTHTGLSKGRLSAMFNCTTLFLDQHLQEFRYVTFGLAAAGVILTARSIHMFKQFQHAKEIPAHFFAKNVRLQGIVKNISRDGTLSVEHIPVVTIRWIRFFNREKRLDLPVKVSGVSLTPGGLPWLHKNLMGGHIWFRLLQEDQHFVHCIVTKRKNLIRNICVNEELVKKGLGTVQLPNSQNKNSLTEKFSKRLLEAEKYAKRKGLGKWERPPVMERAKDKVKEYKTGAINRFKGAMRDVWQKVTSWKKPSS